MTGDQGDGGDNHVDALLDELAVLRSLDRLRRALPVGSAGHAIAVRQIERRSRALINRFREFRPERRDATRPRGPLPGREASRGRRSARPRPPRARPSVGDRRRA